MRRVICACLAGFGLLFLALPAGASSFGVNLVVNGDAEADAAGPSGYEVVPAITGWTRTGNLTLVSWATAGGFPVLADSGPAVRGVNFFAGGPDAATSEISQVIDISDLAGTIDGGTASYRLAGYIGGFNGQEDNARLEMTFRDGALATLGSAQLGPVSVADRGGATALRLRVALGGVPIGTRSILLRLFCTRLAGSYNDGYADSLTLVLSPTPVSAEGAVTTALEFSTIAPNPARTGARFAFRLAQEADVRLELLDLQGRRVAVLADGERVAGPHSVEWRRTAAVRPGIYLARLQADGEVRQRRFVVLD
jgi:hypothetical protein